MKIKYLINDWDLQFEEIYNVFAIQEWSTWEKKIYIAENNWRGWYYISPYDFDDFEIIDTKISKFWEYGINNFWNVCIGIPELFTERQFWEKYYDDDEKINNLIFSYFKVWKNELFNMEK